VRFHKERKKEIDKNRSLVIYNHFHGLVKAKEECNEYSKKNKKTVEKLEKMIRNNMENIQNIEKRSRHTKSLFSFNPASTNTSQNSNLLDKTMEIYNSHLSEYESSHINNIAFFLIN